MKDEPDVYAPANFPEPPPSLLEVIFFAVAFVGLMFIIAAIGGAIDAFTRPIGD